MKNGTATALVTTDRGVNITRPSLLARPFGAVAAEQTVAAVAVVGVARGRVLARVVVR